MQGLLIILCTSSYFFVYLGFDYFLIVSEGSHLCDFIFAELNEEFVFMSIHIFAESTACILAARHGASFSLSVIYYLVNSRVKKNTGWTVF